MAKKQRCPTCSTGWCKNHLLQLIPTASNLYYRKTLKIRLCPKLNKTTNLFQRTVPLFNQDKKFYTPCFYLEEEKKYYIQNDERVMKNHMLKLDQDLNTQNTIFVPRHARKRNYCFVCKCDYNDYMDHMDQSSHKNNLRKNAFTSFILEAQQKFSKERLEQQNIKEDLKRQMPISTDQSYSLGQTSTKSFDFIRKLKKLNQVEQKIQKELIIDE